MYYETLEAARSSIRNMMTDHGIEGVLNTMLHESEVQGIDRNLVLEIVESWIVKKKVS